MATTIAALRRGNFFGNDADIPEAYKVRSSQSS